MPQSTLRFRIRQDGRVEETVEGVVGDSCQVLTESLEEALGVVEKREPTAASYLNPQSQTQNNPAEIL